MNDDQRPPTRERILAAAAAIISEEGLAARLSVRAVAARAGVSTGSLRHHFPTQRELRDEVMRRIYGWIAPGDTIHDTSLPVRERLIQALQQPLALIGAGAQARETMATTCRTFIAGEQTDQVRESYLAIERDAQYRLEHWLTVIAEEGGIPVEDIPRRARFLSTVLNGLGLERALPAEDSLAAQEAQTLAMAVDAVLGLELRDRASDRAGRR
ncbi:TetR/AcrR family transcriptional regulator [Ruania halotolerans]|uniref:TetR/AcrR family transcriptional regulator n=1 Tax=Ruania halotolerans TaxID=2897773 RepID=UPI001E457141|nr:TetR/AcrR family transcriptional regulator [Ruania halotolerans]UFU06306.1 TetR family transcriptional regulator [Ruania halotolerans]